ncbi:universal stress protein [Streptomyces sp. NRRL S-87]|uniref:universal stress protein n=1 Tax=Streptomyces sp. NRRL S-87 TaxID=1463920 RepID=UPI0004C07786|nr:universal stress protein [Streptomyces sp. NRRL S-87]
MRQHVTVGVDGTPQSRAAARWAAREAALRDVPLRIVHVVDAPLIPVEARMDRVAADRWADQELTDAVRDVRDRYAGLEAGTRRLAGRPAAALAAEATDASLLVLGSRGLGTTTGFLLGSVALSTLTAVHTPAALVRTSTDPDPAETPEYRRLVVGVDIHQACDRVLDFAFEEAARRRCPLHAVHAWHLPPAYKYVAYADPDAEDEIQRAVTHLLDDTLLPWRHEYPKVPVTATAVRGHAGHELVRAATDADLVVVGRHVRRSPLGAHLGPVTHAVMHHVTAPVVVVAHD